MNEWLEWEGRQLMPMQLGDDSHVQVRRRDGETVCAPAAELRWLWGIAKQPSDIVSWLLIPTPKHKDTINSPSHYTNGKVEAIDAIEAATTGLEGIEAVCTGNVLKYIFRWKLKNGIEDLKKARWYLDRLIAKVEKDA